MSWQKGARMAETELELAVRHVREMEAVVAEQEQRVAALDLMRHPTELARECLRVMRHTLDVARDHAARLSQTRD